MVATPGKGTYVRVRREAWTIYMHCDEDAKPPEIVAKLMKSPPMEMERAMGKEAKLVAGPKPLNDRKSVGEQGLEAGSNLVLLYKGDDGVWEEVPDAIKEQQWYAAATQKMEAEKVAAAELAEKIAEEQAAADLAAKQSKKGKGGKGKGGKKGGKKKK